MSGAGVAGTETRVLERHDVSDLVGFRVEVTNAAREIVDVHGDTYVEVPDIGELMAAAAMARCLLAVSLRGSELRTIRRIVGWKASELAEHMDVQASPQTVSRWENDKQKMGGYAQKLFRLNVCEALKDRAPGIAYSAGDVARLRVRDPWRNNQSYQVPPVVLEWMKVQAQDRKLIKAYVDDRPELPKAA